MRRHPDNLFVLWIRVCTAPLAILHIAIVAFAQSAAKPPATLEVLPVFFVPRRETPPSAAEKKVVLDHLKWTQRTYRKLLKGKTTFRIANREPLIVKSDKSLAVYHELPESGVPEMVGQILEQLKQDRFSTPYVFLIVVTNRVDDFPVGGGRPLNGGVQEGGGLMCFSQFAFNKIPHVQSTLQHEVGHSFGLSHVDAYKYDMTTNESLMSYNTKHHTNGFADSVEPGVLIPEDLRTLAMNDRGFDNLTFSTTEDVPEKYSLCPYIPSLPPMKIAGQPDYTVQLTSACPDEFSSKLANIVQKQIHPNKGPGVTYNPHFMWSSSPDTTGWVSVSIRFPRATTLDQIVVHSEHSLQYNRVAEVKITTKSNGAKDLASQVVSSDRFHLKFVRTEAQNWLISFRPGPSGKVTIRGLQFFDGEQEWYKPTYILP
ncbi:MAG: hypothetical protein V4719_21930 [Planctomycetota bacterium]